MTAREAWVVGMKSELFTAIIKATTTDPAGHLPNCGYTDEEQVCGCAEWGGRLATAIAPFVDQPTTPTPGAYPCCDECGPGCSGHHERRCEKCQPSIAAMLNIADEGADRARGLA